MGKTGITGIQWAVHRHRVWQCYEMHCVLDKMCIQLLFCMHIGHRCDNFIVGLTNVSPNITTPTLYNYTLCGQYPGAVPNGTTVSLYCQENLPPFRYVIVQIPLTVLFVPCEVEVLVRGTRMSNIDILINMGHSSRQLFNVVISPTRRTPFDCNVRFI